MALAEALTGLLHDEDVRRSLWAERVESGFLALHSMERMIEQTQQVIIEAVNETAPCRRC